MNINLVTDAKPKLGDKKRGQEIGKTRGQLYFWLACKNCGKERWVARSQIQDKRYIGWCRKCGNYRNGVLQGRKNKKTGRRINTTGYVEILINKDNPYYLMAEKSGYIKEHRLVMAQKLGRLLKSNELVHHINGNKQNNNIDNLTLENKNTHGLRYADAYKDGYLKGYIDAIEGKKCELI